MSTGTPEKGKKTKKDSAPQKSFNRRVGIVAAVAVGVAVVALGAIFFLSNSGPSSGQAGNYPLQVGSPGVGEEAPPIELSSTEGGTFELSSATAQGETVLLYFQEGLMCQPCFDQIKDMEAQSGAFEELGIDRTVSITNDPLNALERKVTQEGIASTPVLADPDLAVSRTYEANNYGMMGGSRNGHTFIVVGPDGEIQWRADYGGAPDFTMYVPVPDLLADMREGLEGGAA